MVVIFFGIILFAIQTSRLQAAIDSNRRGRGRYDSSLLGKHVLVCGDPSPSQVYVQSTVNGTFLPRGKLLCSPAVGLL